MWPDEILDSHPLLLGVQMKRNVSLPQCHSCPSRLCSLFKYLDKSLLELLSQNKCGQLYKKGELLFQEGAYSQGIFCIYEGIVKIFKLDSQGNEQILRFAHKTDLIGYKALLTGGRYVNFASAIEDSRVCFIPQETLWQLLKSDNGFATAFLKLLAQESSSSEKQITNMARRTARERLAATLLTLRQAYEVGRILIKRSDLAKVIGTDYSTTMRILKEFKTQRIIETNPQHISILAPQKLAEIAKFVE